MFKLLFGVVLFSTVLLFTGCLKEDKSICNYDSSAVKAPDSEVAAVKKYLDSMGIEATKHFSGLYYTIEEPGSSARIPDICSSIFIKYTGKLTNGNTFDSNNGITFQLGNLIEGWKQGLFLIGKGGKITLYIPPSLGYGSQAVRDIPANSILVFQIELMDFK